jgi:enamine deaminase RidA (YjgF/YER057c/UK114 family)
MRGNVAARLEELGIVLPPPRQPIADYIPVKAVGSLLFVADQVPYVDGKYTCVGKLGADITMAEGREAARLCAINVLAQLNRALDSDLDRIVSCVRLGGFVNSTPSFAEHPKVIDGASNLIVEVFGEAGQHARTAVGCGSLPNGIAVEVDGIFEFRP